MPEPLPSPADAPVHPADAPPPGFTLVRLAAPLVPAARRGEWLTEWAGELAWAWREAGRRGEATALARLPLYLRALGATTDALWLRRRHGADDMLSLDLKYAARSLRRRPGFVSVVVLTLALGIGATTAIFSVVYGVLLRPLPVPHPERVVRLEGRPLDGDTEKVGTATSYPDYLDFRERARSFASLAAVRGTQMTLTMPGTEPARVSAMQVTPDFLPTLGIAPALGRGFLPEEAAPGAAPVAVLSHATWLQRFGGRRDALGRTVTLDGMTATIVGVLPPDTRVVGETAVWTPLVPGPLEQVRGAHRLGVYGRLREGTTMAQAQAEVAAIAKRLEQQHPADNTNRGALVQPLQEALVEDARTSLLVLLGAVGLVLLIGCTNLASLFLARATSREREMAVRAALGAGRGRLARQWVTESLLLTVAGGLAGLAVAWAGMKALLAFAPRTIPRADEIALDAPVLGFLLGASLLTGLVFGLLPAVQRGGPLSLVALRDGGRGATGGRSRRRLREGLVLAEVALATMLVVGAGLLLKSFWRMQQADLGFEPSGLIVAQLQLPAARYDSVAKVLRFYERLHEEVAATPGVRSVSFAYEHPLSEGWTSSYAIAGRPQPAPGTEPEARVRPVWPGYFQTVGLRLVRGRDVTPRDRFGTPGAVMVNEAFARREFAGRDPIGQTLDRVAGWWPGQPMQFTIVGVVADEPFMGPSRAAEPATYYPHAQFPMNDMWLVVRAEGDAAGVAPLLRERIWRVDRDLPVERVSTMSELLGGAVAEPRFNVALLGLFATAALLLAAVGIYGVLSYTVAQRTGEIGVRIALGAGRGQVVRQVVAQGLAVALGGVALGVVGSMAAGGVLSSLLVGVSGRDPAVLAGVVALLTTVAAAAAWLPARRASRVEPVVALRAE